jgi:hypothetical protein
MTNEEFKKRWKRTSPKQKKFCLRYLENGMDPKEAALYAGYTGQFLISPYYRIMRKLNPLIDYLIAKNDLISSIVKPTWIIDQYIKNYENTDSEITKLAILRDLSKILAMQDSGNNKIEINNNIPQQPVTIKFTDNE